MPDDIRIADLGIYLQRMQKSVLDKLFFLDKVFEPFDTIVDFGCADGELIRAIRALFGDEYKFVGYDISDEMIKAARENAPFAAFTTDWDEIDADPGRSLINISSTVHEVYSYCSADEIELFWQRVFGSGFKYVAIRDMMVSEADSAPAGAEDIGKVCSNEKYAAHLGDYESVWGPIRSRRDLVHYLLKYSYTENWEREVRENYLGLTFEEFMRRVPRGYSVTYLSRFTLPYTAWQVKRDFGIDLDTDTHVKVILKKDD